MTASPLESLKIFLALVQSITRYVMRITLFTLGKYLSYCER